jgi:transcriptional regulator
MRGEWPGKNQLVRMGVRVRENRPMYVPPAFQEKDRDVLLRFIERYSFATFITGGDTPQVTHLPLLLDRAANTLQGHFAKANAHWRALDGTREALAIFHGPHAYVSPAWYHASGPAVPTWNYAVVHASGVPEIRSDAAWLKGFVARLTAAYESQRETPWKDALPENFRAAMLTQIVGFEMPVTSLVGKFKLNQNRSAADQEGVIAGLEASGDTELAALMRARKDG